MQDPAHQLSRCPTCQATRGEPCRTRDGRVAHKVHYGRPHWSSKVGKRKRPAQQESIEDHEEARRQAWLAARRKAGLPTRVDGHG